MMERRGTEAQSSIADLNGHSRLDGRFPGARGDHLAVEGEIEAVPRDGNTSCRPGEGPCKTLEESQTVSDDRNQWKESKGDVTYVPSAAVLERNPELSSPKRLSAKREPRACGKKQEHTCGR